MDSRMHSQRQRGRLRVSRAFTPPQQQHQFVQQQQQQQLPHTASSRFHPQQPQQHHHVSPLQHRLSLVDDHFPRAAASSGAGIPLDHCDYAALLAYRQRINGLFSTHPAELVPPHLARSQNAVWPQAQRLQGYRAADNRLALTDEYNRQGPHFDRDYRDTRDDLRSLSELDSSRRSAALSAKLFLDDVRPSFQRSAQFESSPAVGLSRHQIDREESMTCDPVFSKGSERLVEQGLRKRNREDETNMDSRERAMRQRRFHDPGLATIPRTPESSRDFPLVQRMLSSGRFVDGRFEDRQNGHNIPSRATSPLEKQESLYRSPSKSAKKKLHAQHRKTPSDLRHDNARMLKRLDEPKEKLSSPSDPTKTHARNKKLDGQQAARDSKHGCPSPKTSSFGKNSILPGVDAMNRKNKPNNTEVFNAPKDSSVARISRQGTPDKGLEASERNPKQRLAARSLSSIRKALKAVESTPRSKTLKTRVIRLIGSDAKVCGLSPKNRQTEQEGKKDIALELQMMKGTSNCNEAVRQDIGSPHPDRIQETHCGAKVKQEQHVLTDKSTSLQTVTTIELPLPLHAQCQQNFADCASKSLKSNDLLHPGQEKQQNLMSSEAVFPQFPQKEAGHNCWLVASDNSGDLVAGKMTGSSNQPSRTAVQEWTMKDHDLVHPLLSLSVNIDAEVMARGSSVEDHQLAMPSGSSMFGSSLLEPQLCRKAVVAPLIESNKEASMLDTDETTTEREVRLFGKSLKAPVAKLSLGSPHQLSTVDLSVSSMLKSTSPRLHLASDQQVSSVTCCNEVIEAEVDPPENLMEHFISKDEEVVVGSLRKGGDAALVSSNHTVSNPAMPTLDIVDKVQGTRPKSPREPSETVPNVCSDTVLVDPLSVSSVLESEQGAAFMHKSAEKNRDEPPCVSQPEIISPVLATYQREDLTGPEVTIDVAELVVTSSVAPSQTIAKEDLASKDSVTREDSAEAAIEREGRSETFFAEKSTSYIASKQVTSLHQQGRLQKIPGRAGANTWHRPTSNLGLPTSQVLSKLPIDKQLPKVVSQKVSETAAYVRKGNSLVRAPISSIVGVSQSSNPGIVVVGKDLAGTGTSTLSRATRGYPGFKNVVKHTTRSAYRQVFSVQKVAPQEASAKSTSNDKISAAASTPEVSQDGQFNASLHTGARSMMVGISEGQISSSPFARTTGTEESAPVLAVSEAVSEASKDEPIATVQPKPLPSSGQSLTVGSKMPDSSTTLYVKSKANQLIAALPMKTSHVASCHANSSSQEVYYKRNNNQLVRNVLEPKRNAVEYQTSRSKTHEALHSALKKAFRKRVYSPSSKVWTLKDGCSSSQVKSVLPLLFPWKRPSFGLSICAGRYKALPKAKKGSLLFLISKKLQRLRKVQPVYSRSAGGFSLHRSGVLSLNGANLKWTKSIEKWSKQASEEATMAVAAVEKQQRKEKAAVEVAGGVAKSKVQRRPAREGLHGRGRVVTIGLARYKMDPTGRTLQRLPDQWCGDAEVRKSTDLAVLSTPRRLSYDGTEYVRIGNGHKLVRDPKAATRALANEKVRWSLHTARSRWAKKQQYCLFFTRFGKCNKSKGDCPYIHDPEKIAVCTKFLKGTCSEMNCLFSHKVIPERMPDCSFFLEGMCTNEECPYRHVSVNPKAPICEGFLKGFCSDGDECNKKHTTVCPTFLANGECGDRAACKLHHPKKKSKRSPNNHLWKVKSKRRRRYFGMEESLESGQHLDEVHVGNVSSLIVDGSAEFIEVPDVIIDSEENEGLKRKFDFFKEHIQISQDRLQGDADMLIKPVLLLQRPVSV